MGTWELRIINPATSLADIVLPSVETFTIAPMLNDVGTVQFTYPSNGVNADQIINDRDIEIYYNGTAQPKLRSTLEQISYDDADIAEGGSIRTYSCNMALSHLSRGIVYPPGWPTSSNPPDQTFTAASAGGILGPLVSQAQSRGGLLEIDTSSFSDSLDSAGNPWDTTVTGKFTGSTDYLSLTQALVSYGLCDVVTDGYALNLYNFESYGNDLTIVEPPVIIRRGRDLTQSQVQRQTKGMSSVALVAGDNNVYVEVDSPRLGISIDRREIGTSQSGVTDPGTLTLLGQNFIGTIDKELLGRANTLVFSGEHKTPLPLDDFNLGDWVYIDVNDGSLYRQKVIQWTVALASDGTLTGNCVCDTIFQEKIARLNSLLNQVADGLTIIGSSSPAPLPAILFPPMIPAGLAVGSSLYTDNQGNMQAIANVTWDAVTEDTDGNTESNLQSYLIQWTPHGGSVWSQAVAVNSGITACNISPFQVGAEFDFQVGAVDTQGNFSGWSSTISQTMEPDTTPPGVPSTPTMVSQLGQLAITWDGKDNGGHAMPIDFLYTQVYLSTAGSSFTPGPTNLISTFSNGGTLTIPGATLVYGTQYWVKLIAFDRSGNASAASASGTATLIQVVNTDILSGQVGLDSLSFSDVGNLIDDGGFEDVNWRTTRNTAFGGSHFSFTNSISADGSWSVEHTGTGGQTTEQVVLTTVTAKPGQVFMGAADWYMTSLTLSTMFMYVQVKFLDVTGATISTSNLTSNWTSPSTNNATWVDRLSGSPATAPTGTVKAQFLLATSAHTAGIICVDDVEIRMQLDNLLIANAAITDAKISDMSANKITVGTMSAGLIVSGSLSTASSGQRCVMDGTGFHAYDSSGNMIFDVNDSSPIITLGKHATGASISIDTSAVYPIINFSPNTGTIKAFINALTSGSGSTGIGVNSGTYASPIDSATVSQRLFLEAQGSIELASVNAAQQPHGGALELYDLYSTFGQYNAGTLEVGLHLDLGSTEISATGMFNNGIGFMNATDAWNTGGESGLTGFGGAALSYGTTVSGLMLPIPGVRNVTASASCYLSGSSPTGFNIGWTTATVTNCSWWATRM